MSRVVLIGSRCSGKTRIFQRLVKAIPFLDSPSPTNEINTGSINLSGQYFTIYDTPGTMSPLLIPVIRDATTILLVYDAGHSYAYHHISYWMEIISRYTSDPIILVSDQVDRIINHQNQIQLSPFHQFIRKQVWVDSLRGRNLIALQNAIMENDMPIQMVDNQPLTTMTHAAALSDCCIIL